MPPQALLIRDVSFIRRFENRPVIKGHDGTYTRGQSSEIRGQLKIRTRLLSGCLTKDQNVHFNRRRILFLASGQSVNPEDPSLYSISLFRRTSACQDGEGTAPGVRCRSSYIFSSALSLSEVLILSSGISKSMALALLSHDMKLCC